MEETLNNLDLTSLESFDLTSFIESYGNIMFQIYVVFLVLSFIYAIALWKIFTKANKPGWASLVPFYNLITLIEISGMKKYWFLLSFLPIFNAIFYIKISYNLSKSFGLGKAFGTFVLLFKPLAYAVIAFNKNIQYSKDIENNFLDFLEGMNVSEQNQNNQNNNIQTQNKPEPNTNQVQGQPNNINQGIQAAVASGQIQNQNINQTKEDEKTIEIPTMPSQEQNITANNLVQNNMKQEEKTIEIPTMPNPENNLAQEQPTQTIVDQTTQTIEIPTIPNQVQEQPMQTPNIQPIENVEEEQKENVKYCPICGRKVGAEVENCLFCGHKF